MSPFATLAVFMVLPVVALVVLVKGTRPGLRLLRQHWRLGVAVVLALGFWGQGTTAGRTLATLAIALGVAATVRHRRRASALAEGRVLPRAVERKATRLTATADLPTTGTAGPFSEVETFAVSRLLPGVWPKVAHGVGLSQRDMNLEARGEGLAAAGALVGLIAARHDNSLIFESDRAYRTPALLSLPVPSPTGPRVRITLLPGQTPTTVASKAEALAAALRAPAVQVLTTEEDARTGAVTLSIRTREALTSAPTGVPAPALDLACVTYGVGEDGVGRSVSLKNLSGWAVGGVPGSGKTASMTYAVAGLMQNPAVQFAVLDGKGGSDWAWAAPRAAAFTNDDENFSAMAEPIEQAHQLMRHRLGTQKAERGSANFWALPPAADHPAIVLLIDECQTIFEVSGMGKEEKAQAEAIKRKVSALIKKGRSAGIVTVLMTQKPTADALPTALRDNCSLRTAFRVLTREAAEAVLGAIPAGTPTLPTDIPSNLPGVAVVASDRGGFERVRFGYIDEEEAERLAQETAALRRPLEAFLPTTTNDEGEENVDVCA